jgi:hypothetical protein
MTKEQFIQDVAQISEDIWRCKILAKNNNPLMMRRFREPREALPFGFEWMGMSIEVHPFKDNAAVVALNIYGVQRTDGRLTLLVTEPV